jgi:hypothetical protein
MYDWLGGLAMTVLALSRSRSVNFGSVAPTLAKLCRRETERSLEGARKGGCIVELVEVGDLLQGTSTQVDLNEAVA